MLEELRQFFRDNPRLPLIIAVAVLTTVVVVVIVWGGFGLEIGRFFAAEPGTDSGACPVTPGGNTVSAPIISVECGETQNVLAWTGTESIEGVRVQLQRNSYDASGVAVEGGNLTDEVGCTGTFTVNSFIDTTAPAGLTNSYVIKVGGRQIMWSNVATCSPPPAPSLPAPAEAAPVVAPVTIPVADTTQVSAPLRVPVTAQAAPAASQAAEQSLAVSGSCAYLYPSVAKCYQAHSCMGRSDATCGATFVTNESPGEIGYGVYYGFEDVYKAPDGTVYWFNWRSQSPPENDPTTWTWAKIPSNPQAWCASPAQGIVSVQAPTTNLHAIFDAQAQAGRFGCAVAKVGAYNNKGDSVGIDCAASEKLFYACRASLNDNTPEPTPPPTPATEPSESPAPEAAPGLVCTPESQTIFLGQTAFFQAFGGDGVYKWAGGPSTIQEEGDGFPGTAAFTWTVYGPKLVRVESAGQTATCLVEVMQFNVTPTPTPGPTGPIAIVKKARNLSLGQTAPREKIDVRDGQRIEFIIRIFDREGDGTGEIFLSDMIPPGMSYILGSTTVNKAKVADTIGDSLSLGSLPPRGEFTVRWEGLADRLGELPAEARTVQVEATAQTTEAGESFTRSDGVELTLFGTGTGLGGPLGGVGAIPTGPGETTLLAFVLAATSSLLYAAYTRSPKFRRREVGKLKEDQGSLDFRQ